jgi:Kef-type K+ transport system membrane component KefB/CBS domain-containing protein
MLPMLLSLGLLYLVALGAGRLAARLHFPRVTGYLLAGLLVGPSAAAIAHVPSIITEEQLNTLTPLYELALGLIVLTIGGSFDVKTIRRFGLKLVGLSIIEMGVTAALVALAAILCGTTVAVAGFLALMAITTAPAATQMVVREYNSEGRLTDLVMTLIGFNNLTAIVAFVLYFHHIVTPNEPLLGSLQELGLPILVGILTGTALALMDQRLTAVVERQILGLSAVAVIVGICGLFQVSPMPAALAAGAVLVNSSPHGKRLFNDLRKIDFPLYVIFFVMAGARLHIEALPHMGVIGIAYIVARCLGKFGGSYLGSRIMRMGSSARTWLGPAMMAQAGLAIGLAQELADNWGTSGHTVQTVILAAVVLFEGIGPILTRTSLVKAGEVTVLNLLFQRSPVGYFEGLHQVVEHFRDALGIPQSFLFKKPTDILVAHVMQRNVEVIQYDLSFNGILRTFGHSRYDRLPVVDDEQNLVGVIQYSDVSEILVDDMMRNLVVAGDIASMEHALLNPNDTIEKAMDNLRKYPDHTHMLVVDDKDPGRLVGVVRQNDVLAVQQRIGKKK